MEILSLSFLEMADGDTVERAADGLPRSRPLLQVGDNVATRSAGMPVNIRLTHDDFAAIGGRHAANGRRRSRFDGKSRRFRYLSVHEIEKHAKWCYIY